VGLLLSVLPFNAANRQAVMESFALDLMKSAFEAGIHELTRQSVDTLMDKHVEKIANDCHAISVLNGLVEVLHHGIDQSSLSVETLNTQVRSFARMGMLPFNESLDAMNLLLNHYVNPETPSEDDQLYYLIQLTHHLQSTGADISHKLPEISEKVATEGNSEDLLHLVRAIQGIDIDWVTDQLLFIVGDDDENLFSFAEEYWSHIADTESLSMKIIQDKGVEALATLILKHDQCGDMSYTGIVDYLNNQYCPEDGFDCFQSMY